MCVAIIVPTPEKDKPFTPPTRDILSQCEAANDAGGGIAWIDHEGILNPKTGKRFPVVRFKKGLEVDELLDIMARPEVKPPYFLHFRIPTIGGSNPALCHPFPLNAQASLELEGYAEAVLMHNGHWSGWREGLLNLLREKAPTGAWSDTRAMAYLSYWYSPSILAIINEKTAVLSTKGLRYFGDGWSSDNGVWYSNMSWKHTHKLSKKDRREKEKRDKEESEKREAEAKERAKNRPVTMNNAPGVVRGDGFRHDSSGMATSKIPFLNLYMRDEEDRKEVQEWLRWNKVEVDISAVALGEVRISLNATSKPDAYLTKEYGEANAALEKPDASRIPPPQGDLMVINGGTTK